MSPATAPTTFAGLVDFILGLVNMLIPLLIGAAFLFLMWKLVDAWIIHSDDASKIEEGKTITFTGVIIFVILLSIWGILAILRHSLVG